MKKNAITEANRRSFMKNVMAGTWMVLCLAVLTLGQAAGGAAASSNAILKVNPLGSCATAPLGTVGWWKAEGNAQDTAGTNSGVVLGNLTYGAGEVGQAFNLNGVDAAVKIPASSTLDMGPGNGFTVEGWINPATISGEGHILEFNNGTGNQGVLLQISTFGPGDLCANVIDTSGNWHVIDSASGLITTSTWQHVGLTYDKASGVGKLYLNGVVVAQQSLGVFTPQTSYDCYLGHRASGGSTSYWWLGLLDEISLYNRALADSEVQAIYTAGSGGKCPGGISPSIVAQPTNQTVLVGGSATFAVAAVGSLPLSYQWYLRATNTLSGATNPILTLNNVQLNQAGNYSVRVSNAYGTATSSNGVLTVNPVLPCTPVPAGLVGWWKAEGNAQDSVGANNGVALGNLTYGAGEVGEAFSLNGADAGVEVPANATLDVGQGNGLTVEGWINPAVIDVERPVVEWNNGLGGIGVYLWVSTQSPYGNGPGCLSGNVTDTGGNIHAFASAAGLVASGSYEHVALTYDKASGVGKLYLNGVVVAQQSLGVFTPQTSYDFYLGHRASGGAQAYWWVGAMDEIGLYNRALGDSEVQAIYSAGGAGKCVGGISPSIVAQPTNQTVLVGGSATFAVAATGSLPLSYQWYLGATNTLSGATNPILTLSNAQLNQAGNYSVRVSNAYGMATSSNAVLTVNPISTCDPSPSGLVGWWKAEGNTQDSVGANDGLALGNLAYGAGEVGQAFNLNGVDAGVEVPASAALDVGQGNGLTVEGWINPAVIDVERPVVEWNNGLGGVGVYLWVSTQPTFGNGPGCLSGNVTDTGGNFHAFASAAGLVASGSYQHVALTYDKASGVGKLYLNGVVVAQQSLGVFTPQTSYDLYLGHRASGGAQAYWWVGAIDEISLYNRALGNSEIQAIYTAGGAGKCVGGISPSIVMQPTNQTVLVGGSATFAVAATGSLPLSYQWYFGATNAISGATNPILTLSNVQLNQAGNYSVRVSNVYGMVTSSNAVLTVNSLPPCDPPPAGLVAWWKAEDNAQDGVGTNNGLVLGNLAYAAGEVGQAFNLNGVDAAVRIPASSTLDVGQANGLTVEGWINPAVIDVERPVVEWNNGLGGIGVYLWVSTQSPYGNGPGCLSGNVADTGGNIHAFASAAGLVASGSYEHVALTYDKASGVGKLYLNGVVVAQQSLGVFTPQTSYDLYLGHRASGGAQAYWWVGAMDEISLYNRALGNSEIQAIYTAGGAGKCPGGISPSIVAQPTNQTVLVGGSATFAVAATGSLPLSYQWYLGATSTLSGATNPILTLTNVQLNQAGNYSVRVSNAYGMVTSSNAVLTVNPVPPCDPPPSGLVGWWKAEGNMQDSVGANDGLVLGNLAYGAGEVGQAFNLNGVDAGVEVPANSTLDIGRANGLTVEGWINPAVIDVERPVVEWNNGLGGVGVYLWVSTRLPFGNGPGCLSGNVTDTRGNFHAFASTAGLVASGSYQHVALTYDKASGVGKLYLNGVVVAQQSLGVFTPQTSYDLYLGHRASGGAQAYWWVGAVDEISLYDRALGNSEVQAIYSAGAGGKCVGGISPSIVMQPTNQTVLVGGSATFAVAAAGSLPLSYQWYLGATNTLSGATNPILTLSNVQLNQVGNYSVRVSNAYGMVTSSNAVLTVNPVPPCDPPPSGLVGWWKGEGNAQDGVGTNNGLALGNLAYGAGEVGQAFNLNGVDAAVKIPASSTLDIGRANGLTVEGWINPAVIDVERPVVEWNNGTGGEGVLLWVSTRFPLGNGPGCLNGNLVDTGGNSHTFTSAAGLVVSGSYQHVALTYDKASGVGKLYLNGAVVAQQSLGVFTPQTSYDLYLGHRASGGAQAYWWVGAIDEISLYDRALGNSEVQAIYSAGAGGKCVGGISPSIVAQPTNQRVQLGGSASFAVAAAGSLPLSYQWYFNGINPVAGGTNASLTLVNVQLSEAGNYAVTITNAYGTATSSNAMLIPLARLQYQVVNGQFSLQFVGVTGQLYYVQASTDLVHWFVLGAATDLGNGNFNFVDPFWKIRQQTFYEVIKP